MPTLDGTPPALPPNVSNTPPAAPTRPPTRKMFSYGSTLLQLIFAQIAMALGDVEVLGMQPLAFLTQWGQQIQQEASAAYTQSQAAQEQATYSAGQVAITQGTNLAAEVPAGAGRALSNDFTGPVAADLGASFARVSEGPGVGGWGPDGTGQIAYAKSGGQSRTHHDRHITALGTRYQIVTLLITEAPQPARDGSPAYQWIRGRVNAAQSDFVYTRLGAADIQIGCRVAGVPIVFATFDFTAIVGTWAFLLGTGDDDRDFILKRNGQPVWRDIDALGLSQVDDTDHLFAGLSGTVGDRDGHTDQTVCGRADMWVAADRLPTKI